MVRGRAGLLRAADAASAAAAEMVVQTASTLAASKAGAPPRLPQPTRLRAAACIARAARCVPLGLVAHLAGGSAQLLARRPSGERGGGYLRDLATSHLMRSCQIAHFECWCY